MNVLTGIRQRTDVAEKVVPDSDPAKEMYSRYATECTVSGRPYAASDYGIYYRYGNNFPVLYAGRIIC